MKNIVLIIIVSFLFIGCKKEELNELDYSYWIAKKVEMAVSENTKTLHFLPEYKVKQVYTIGLTGGKVETNYTYSRKGNNIELTLGYVQAIGTIEGNTITLDYGDGPLGNGFSGGIWVFQKRE